MKTKLLLVVAALFIYANTQAQIADGSVAPDFTVDDIFGNTHSLQDYLDDGKTVILNISATWCGPCWNYMQGGAFKDVYLSHGSLGSGDIVILYIEGSANPNEAVDLLYGIGDNTLGNWVDGTPYPIIASQALASSYQISYFPTIYRICPDGFVFEMGQLNRQGIINNLESNCSGVSIDNVDDHVAAEVKEIKVCEDGETTEVQIEVTNYGNTITSLEVEVDVNGVIETVTEDVSVNKWGTTIVGVEITANEGDQVFAEVISVNNNSPHNPEITLSETVTEVAAPTGRDVVINVYTDNYPGEISWNILDESGNAVVSGGPYQEGNDDQWGGGGPDAQTTKTYEVNLPGGEQCFNIELLDSFGDGWSLSAANWDPGIEIFYQGESIYKEVVGNFGFEIEFDKAMKHLVTMNAEDFEFQTLNVYPNPSNGRFNVTSSDEFEVTVFNMQGKKVYQQKGLSRNATLNLNEASGIYIAEFISGTKKSTQKLIIK